MTSRSIATLAAAVFAMTVVQFFSALGSPWIALGAAVALPFIAVGLMSFFEVQLAAAWLIGSTVVASALGVVLSAVARQNDPLLVLCPFVACGVIAAIIWWRGRDTQRCNLCNSRIAGEVTFTCPRCGMVVCENRCWDFVKLRCNLCVQNHVPVLPPDGRWWDRIFGPATPYGSCNLCQVGGGQTELRNCPKCGRPQCRDCWDDANGVCSRCQWTIPELPDALKTYMGV